MSRIQDSTKAFPIQPIIKLHFQYSDAEETTQSNKENKEMISKIFNEFQDQLHVHIQSEAALVAKVCQKQQKIAELKSKLQSTELENKSLKNQVTLFVLKQNLEPSTKSEMPMVRTATQEVENSAMARSMHQESEKSPKVPTINLSSPRKEPEPRRSPRIPRSPRQSEGSRSSRNIDPRRSPHASLESKVLQKIPSLENSPSRQKLIENMAKRQAEAVGEHIVRYLNQPSQAVEDKQVQSRTDSNLKSAQDKSKSGLQSIFTKVQAGLFQYEILPYIEHPKDILVLKCLNKEHFEVIKARSGGIVLHYERQNDTLRAQVGNENLSEAVMALDAAIAGLNQLQKADAQVIKSMAKPPQDIKNVMDMVVMILTGNETPNWTNSRRLLGDSKFLQRLKYFDKENISRSVIVNCREIIRSNKLCEQRMKKVGRAATAFFKWVHALVCIYHNPKVQETIQIKADIQQALDALRSLNSDQIGTSTKHKRVGSMDPQSIKRSGSSQIPSHVTRSADCSEPASPRHQDKSPKRAAKFSEYQPSKQNVASKTPKDPSGWTNLTGQEPKPKVVPRVRQSKRKYTLRSQSAEQIRLPFDVSDRLNIPNLDLEEVKKVPATTTQKEVLPMSAKATISHVKEPILPENSMFEEPASSAREPRSKGWKRLRQLSSATFDSPANAVRATKPSGWKALIQRSTSTFDEPASSARKRTSGWKSLIKPVLGKNSRHT